MFANILMESKKTINYQGSETMKKSTLALATLLTALSAAPVMSVAYADEAPAPAADSSKPACAGADGAKPACAGAACSGSHCAGAEHKEGGDE